MTPILHTNEFKKSRKPQKLGKEISCHEVVNLLQKRAFCCDSIPFDNRFFLSYQTNKKGKRNSKQVFRKFLYSPL